MKTSKAIGLAWCVLFIGQPAAAQAPAPQGSAPPEIKVVATRLGGDVYGIDGQGGRMAALVGPEGVFLVDSQFAPVTEKIVATLQGLSPAPLRFLVNTHVHGDHSGGNENFAKLGVTILGRPNLRNEQLKPRPAPGNGQVPPVAPPAALPIVLFDGPTTIYLDGETVQAHPAGARAHGRRYRREVRAGGRAHDRRRVSFRRVSRRGGHQRRERAGTIEALTQLVALAGPNTKVVPGHGPVVDRAALVFHRDMAVTVRDRVAKALQEGKSAADIRASKPTAEFEQKVGGPPNFIAQFVDGLITELSARR